jgi:hypothetical protein
MQETTAASPYPFNHPRVALQPLLGPGLVQNAPLLFSIFYSYPPASYSLDLYCIPPDDVHPSCSWFSHYLSVSAPPELGVLCDVQNYRHFVETSHAILKFPQCCTASQTSRRLSSQSPLSEPPVPHKWPVTDACFQASVAVWTRSAPFWNFTQLELYFRTDVSGQPIVPIFKGQGFQKFFLDCFYVT